MPFQIISGDITQQSCDAIVNPTDVVFSGSGGTDYAIHQAAGPKLREACDLLGQLRFGDARLTKGYALPASWVIHTAGPVWDNGAQDAKAILADCYQNALALAAEQDFQSVVFPLIAAGTNGFPKEEALSIAVEQIRRFLRSHEMDVFLVVHDRSLYRIDPRTEADVDRYLSANLIQRPLFSNAKLAMEEAAPRPTASFFKESAAAPPTASMSLADRLESMDEGFSEAILRMVDERGMTDAQCYKKANVSKQVFSKLRSNPAYRPSKTTALAFAVALELNLEQTRALLEKAGLTLSHSLPLDVIVEYFISSGKFDVMEINETLYQYDQALLGAK